MALESCKGGQWSCIKLGVLEAKASVHTVGGTAEIKERKRAQKSQKGTYLCNEPHPNSNSDLAVLLRRELISNCSNKGVLRSLSSNNAAMLPQ